MESKSNSPQPTLEKQLKGHRGAITSLFYNPNGQQIASSSVDHSVLVNIGFSSIFNFCHYKMVYFFDLILVNINHVLFRCYLL